MIAALILGALQISAVYGAATPPPDWNDLPALRYQQQPTFTPDMARYVRDQFGSGRCVAPAPVAGRMLIQVDLVVLVASATGQVVRVVPRAINCPTVEQYAAGLIEKMVRDNVAQPVPPADTWFRTGMTFSWTP